MRLTPAFSRSGQCPAPLWHPAQRHNGSASRNRSRDPERFCPRAPGTAAAADATLRRPPGRLRCAPFLRIPQRMFRCQIRFPFCVSPFCTLRFPTGLLDNYNTVFHAAQDWRSAKAEQPPCPENRAKNGCSLGFSIFKSREALRFLPACRRIFRRLPLRSLFLLPQQDFQRIFPFLWKL